MPTDKLPADEPAFMYSSSIIEPAAHSMADAFLQRVYRFRPDDRAELIRLIRERIQSGDSVIADLLSGKT